jgi:hypothetical protein
MSTDSSITLQKIKIRGAPFSKVTGGGFAWRRSARLFLFRLRPILRLLRSLQIRHMAIHDLRTVTG